MFNIISKVLSDKLEGVLIKVIDDTQFIGKIE